MRPNPTANIRGFEYFHGFLDPKKQAEILADLRVIVGQAPLFSPLTPSGRKMSVRLSAAGKYGWFSDRKGYRYVTHHPNGQPWPPIPNTILEVWEALAPDVPAPECCLINFYGEDTKMGMHQDKDEANFDWPVISISLGDEALFRMGNIERGGKTESIWLQSGDVMVMGGDARLCHHGIDRIKFGSSNLLSQKGRINLTLRVVN